MWISHYTLPVSPVLFVRHTLLSSSSLSSWASLHQISHSQRNKFLPLNFSILFLSNLSLSLSEALVHAQWLQTLLSPWKRPSRLVSLFPIPTHFLISHFHTKNQSFFHFQKMGLSVLFLSFFRSQCHTTLSPFSLVTPLWSFHIFFVFLFFLCEIRRSFAAGKRWNQPAVHYIYSCDNGIG